MSALRDNQGQPLSPRACLGRRAFRWSKTTQAFGLPATIVQVRTGGLSDGGLVLKFEDGSQVLCLATEVMIPAASQEMLEAGANALFLSYRRQADLGKTEQQIATAEKHARIVLEAAVEGRR